MQEPDELPSLVILKQNMQVMRGHSRAINYMTVVLVVLLVLLVLLFMYVDRHNILSNIVRVCGCV